MTRTTRRAIPKPPAELGVRDGLAYALFLPPEQPVGAVLILHGAGSCKESHYDFARAARGAGMAAVAFDQRGHGESPDQLDQRLLEDIASMAELLPPGPLALRGSSMGGYLALLAAAPLRARAVVAICPTSAEQLLRGLRSDAFEFRADRPALEVFLEAHDLGDTVTGLDTALLIMHAEGDEQVPVAQSIELHRAARTPDKRLIVVPGGHHRSIQHDSELQAAALRFIARAFKPI
ncbi:MAG TPA: alpha/beta fold hydrolase [Solirubrobacteraceae bacterium]|nr:alpha/beta fold hydrolase [Solirubrobacteraceae bacterium]